jgi:hypothetical protein
MNISPYFRNLRTAYLAELDDLTFDSEGNNILSKRLAQRRKEMEFLAHMLEISPEMVAVVFHKAFRFSALAVFDNLVSLEPEDLPEWASLADCLSVEPWAQPLVEQVCTQPKGEWFLCVAAGLEYLYHLPEHPQSSGADNGDAAEEEDADAIEDRERDEASAEWLAEQGFDRKE